MSAIGPKRTFRVAPHMSAFGGKADMTFCGNPLSRSLLGAKRTCRFALHMSANDPKRTCGFDLPLAFTMPNEYASCQFGFRGRPHAGRTGRPQASRDFCR